MDILKKYTPLTIALIFGAAMIGYGGYDDSPGLQFLGLILLVVATLRMTKKNRGSR